mmetsp:Transcript_18710/g.57543  ORF Transcript_18710/g.57543 Transcript_18710/m.57543 type:complete len:357 (+) Transcript_18710:1618-2688(+)
MAELDAIGPLGCRFARRRRGVAHELGPRRAAVVAFVRIVRVLFSEDVQRALNGDLAGEGLGTEKLLGGGDVVGRGESTEHRASALEAVQHLVLALAGAAGFLHGCAKFRTVVHQQRSGTPQLRQQRPRRVRRDFESFARDRSRLVVVVVVVRRCAAPEDRGRHRLLLRCRRREAVGGVHTSGGRGGPAATGEMGAVWPVAALSESGRAPRRRGRRGLPRAERETAELSVRRETPRRERPRLQERRRVERERDPLDADQEATFLCGAVRREGHGDYCVAASRAGSVLAGVLFLESRAAPARVEGRETTEQSSHAGDRRRHRIVRLADVSDDLAARAVARGGPRRARRRPRGRVAAKC